MKAVRINKNGDVKVLHIEELPLPEPGPGMARVKIQFAGVNFIDVYARTGLNRVPCRAHSGRRAPGSSMHLARESRTSLWVTASPMPCRAAAMPSTRW